MDAISQRLSAIVVVLQATLIYEPRAWGSIISSLFYLFVSCTRSCYTYNHMLNLE